MTRALCRVLDRASSAFAVLALLVAVIWLLVSAFAKLSDTSIFSDALMRQGLLPQATLP